MKKDTCLESGFVTLEAEVAERLPMVLLQIVHGYAMTLIESIQSGTATVDEVKALLTSDPPRDYNTLGDLINFAAGRGCAEIFAVILATYDRKEIGKALKQTNGKGPIMWAVEGRSAEILRTTISYWDERDSISAQCWNSRDSKGDAKREEKYNDFFMKNEQDQTLLMLGVLSGDIIIFKLLIEMVKSASYFLHSVHSEGDLMRYLTAPGRDGNTAFMLAMKKRNQEMIMLFMNSFSIRDLADAKRNSAQETVFHLAGRSGLPEVVQELESRVQLHCETYTWHTTDGVHYQSLLKEMFDEQNREQASSSSVGAASFFSSLQAGSSSQTSTHSSSTAKGLGVGQQ